MKQYPYWTVLLVLLLIIAGCAPYSNAPSSSQPTGGTPRSPSRTFSSSIAFLFEIQGTVELTRAEWNKKIRTPISSGAEFHKGDVLFLMENSSITMICPNLTSKKLSHKGSYGIGDICPATEPLIWTNDGNVLSSPRGHDSSIPYILSPRATVLLNATPVLRWTPAAGARSYKVIVKADIEMFSTTTDKTSILYAGDPLVPGKDYRLIVIPDTNPNLTDQDPNRTFRLATSEESANVRANLTAVKQLKLSEVDKLLVITHIYRNHNLYAEGIDQVEGYLASASLNNGRLAAQLAEMYLQINLPELVLPRCEIAIAKATSANDQDMLAQAFVCAARGQAANGELDKAKDFILKARAIYIKLGNQAAIKLIDDALRMP